MDPNASEEEFRKALVDYALLLGYMHFHPRPCRVKRDDEETYETAYDGFKGYPDETFVHERNGFTLITELKSKSGRVSPHQQRWIDALKKGPTPVYVWRPADWAKCLSVLEAGARGEPSVREQKDQTPVAPKDDPDRRQATITVDAWWNWHKDNNDGRPPTAQRFPAVVGVVAKLYRTGWTTREVKQALLDAPTVSVGTMEFARNQHRRKTGHAVNSMSIEEWQKRNAGKPLTDREPRPEPAKVETMEIIDTTATEA